ncbi:putative cytochrome B domain protein, partial [Toxoplasma gondii MAS]
FAVIGASQKSTAHQQRAKIAKPYRCITIKTLCCIFRVRALLGRTSDGSADDRICTDIFSRRHQLHSQVLFGVHLRRVHGFLTVRAVQYSSSGKDSLLVTPLFKTLAHSLVVTRVLLCRGRNKLCVTYLVREVAAGWEFKTLHATTASFVFVCIFVHVTRILSRCSHSEA